METGYLEEVQTADLLRGLADRDATGCLRIEHHGTQARVYFRAGNVYTAAAPEARARLGDRLVGAGHISEDQLTETLELQRSLSTPRRIGELLIERGLIDREMMRSYVREQIADSVAVALSWTAGTWAFSEDEQVAEDVPLDMSVENLLMEGARRLEEWEIIQARIGSVDAVVDFVSSGNQAELSLTPDEWAMLTRIDGASSIREIALSAGYGQFEAARIIYGLLTAGVVSLVEVDESELDYLEDDEGETPSPVDELDLSAPAAVPPAPTAPAGQTPPVGPARDINRNELLREFAALDEEDAPAEQPAPQQATPPKPPPPRPQRPQEEEKKERRGLFSRLRKD